MAQYLDYDGLKTVLGKIDATFERKGSAEAVETSLNARIDGVEGIIGARTTGEGDDAVAATGIYADIEKLEADVKKANAKDAATTADVQVLGGPLADDVLSDEWPEDWYGDDSKTKIIPEGTSIQDLVANLFFKVKKGGLGTPTYSWSPSLSNKPTASLGTTASVPVGTSVVVTFAVSSDAVSGNAASASISVTGGYGYYEADTQKSGTSISKTAKDAGKAGSLTATAKFNGEDVENKASVVIVEGENVLNVTQSGITVTPGTFDDVDFFAADNTGAKVSTITASITEEGWEGSTKYAVSKDLSNINTAKVTGYYPYYCGLLTEPVSVWNDDAIKHNGSEECASKITSADGNRGYFIAVPEGSAEASKSSVVIKNSAETAQFGNAVKLDDMVEITVAGTAKKNYVIFYFCNAAAWGGNEVFDKFIWA